MDRGEGKKGVRAANRKITIIGPRAQKAREIESYLHAADEYQEPKV
jgi:hypothetical protein